MNLLRRRPPALTADQVSEIQNRRDRRWAMCLLTQDTQVIEDVTRTFNQQCEAANDATSVDTMLAAAIEAGREIERQKFREPVEELLKAAHERTWHPPYMERLTVRIQNLLAGKG